MQPGSRPLRASSRHSLVPKNQVRRERITSLALGTKADVIAALERPPNLSYEVSFTVTNTFFQEDFDLLNKTCRTREETVNQILSVFRSSELKITFIGLTSGEILYFQHDLTGPPERSASVKKICQHSGAVHCLQVVLNPHQDNFRVTPLLSSGKESWGTSDPWLLSGSADRTVKVWRVFEKRLECVQTLGGHGGTVVTFSLCIPYLVSSSTDGALLVWSVDAAWTKVPTFTLVQKVQNGSASTSTTKGTKILEHSWFESIAARWAGDKVRICAGSTDGSIVLLESNKYLKDQISEESEANLSTSARPSRRSNATFTIIRKMQMHSLCTRRVYALPLESVVVTVGSDAGIAVVDPFLGQVWWKQTNSHGVPFSAIAWDAKESLLLAGDDSGMLSYFNIYSHERVASQQICDSKIVHISVDLGKRGLTIRVASPRSSQRAFPKDPSIPGHCKKVRIWHVIRSPEYSCGIYEIYLYCPSAACQKHP
ncbi:uncharacterized protein LOC113146960 [Cyclospora cayetanensis]|uniref:Uncharacterized protein LOC113146960 n=1 Tax=Cyclospora cayetanensis TaxID=88456 RepID=A0A6P6RWY2_9EIME|nr:uncharacterized protein LOC113146960 [Cyclospora cayetanensis]